MPSTPAAHVQPELVRQRRQSPLERADHAGGDARRVPVHPHHRAEALEPERMREPTQQLVACVLEHDRLAHQCAEPRHALGQPARHAPAMQRQAGAARAAAHGGGRVVMRAWSPRAISSCATPDDAG